MLQHFCLFTPPGGIAPGGVGGGKHALRQHARRRRRNTSIATGNLPTVTRITMKNQTLPNTSSPTPPPPSSSNFINQNFKVKAAGSSIIVSSSSSVGQMGSVGQITDRSSIPQTMDTSCSQHGSYPSVNTFSESSCISANTSQNVTSSPLYNSSLASSLESLIITSSNNRNIYQSSRQDNYCSQSSTSQSNQSTIRSSPPNTELNKLIHNRNFSSILSPQLVSINPANGGFRQNTTLDLLPSSVGSDLSSIVNSAISSVVTISARNNNDHPSRNTSDHTSICSNQIPRSSNGALHNLNSFNNSSKSIISSNNRLSNNLSSLNSNKHLSELVKHFCASGSVNNLNTSLSHEHSQSSSILMNTSSENSNKVLDGGLQSLNKNSRTRTSSRIASCSTPTSGLGFSESSTLNQLQSSGVSNSFSSDTPASNTNQGKFLYQGTEVVCFH